MLIIPILSTININNTYKKYKNVENKKGQTGYDVARLILDNNDLNDLYIVEAPGVLTDCYDAERKTVKLSTDIYHGTSIAALAVAAHECGHALQDKEGYSWMRLRSQIFPIVSFGTKIAYVLLLIGLFLQALDFIYLAIALTFLGLAFQLVTLPVEFDASARALAKIKDYKLATNHEEEGVQKVLKSAALTYVAGVLSACLEILYLILRYTDRD